ncbi:repetitive organellar protein-like isoform X2 [Bombus affinis]|uniref:repetitive organellar protein-like isoform X2 n=1 Tax=Bombus affinis TaxID=309941 RepID=UPI0021B71FF7|nr:repetitive organellar protein-like isoform X2 [Bombus affinis]
MVDRSETSNANLEDITKALEDMDSLDIKLFNDTFKNSNSNSVLKDFNIQSDGEIKKKVIFKDSNEDDLLTDLLSDEEISVKEGKNLFTSNIKSNLMEDLFKIKNPVTSANIRSNNELGFHFEQAEANRLSSQKLSDYSISENNFASQNESIKDSDTQKLKNVSRNEEDILTSLIDKSDVIDKTRRPSLLEHLFENQSNLSNVMDSIIPKNNKKIELETKAQSTNTIHESKLDTTNVSTRSFTKESRRGRRSTKIVNDPLGLLSADLLLDQSPELVSNGNVPKNSIIQNTKTEKDLPEWLGGSKKLEDNKSEIRMEAIAEIDKIDTSKKKVEIHDANSTINLKPSGANDLGDASIFPEHFTLLYSTQLNQQNALVNMQQQEHELRTAAILSQQNEQLNKISSAQHSMLHNQEEQFNALLKLQFEKQLLLEKQIKMQQERINQYIHVLMTQPGSVSSTTSIYTSCKSDLCEEEKKFVNEIKEMKDIIKRLEGEKSKLENKLSIIDEKYNNEISFQAEFYERQISFLKDSITKSEERVKHEIEYLETDYITKFEKLRDEKLQLENQYKEEIHNLKNKHAQHIEELCKLHSENVTLLQREYYNIIESISKAKQIEAQMIETMTTRKTDIEDILQKANVIIEGMVENKNRLEIKHNEIMESETKILKLQEDDIKAQKHELKYQNSVLEEHRNKFIETTEKFDTHLTQLITELQKQSTLYTQATETLQKKTTNLLREKELFEEKMKWERDYMQALKEAWVKEQEKQLKLLAEEKGVIATEKTHLEVLNKLKSNSGETIKLELETAIKTAQDANASASREKLKWQEKINELNVYKEILQDKENLLILHAKELEYLTQSALTKKEEGVKALKNAKHLENQNKEKFNQLQIQIQALMEREKKVATEKYNVTKDKIKGVLSAYETERPERDVSHNFQNEIIPSSGIQSKSEITTELMNIVDPNLIMLKLNINDDFKSINKYM